MLQSFDGEMHQLDWFFNEAEGAIKQLRSTWNDTIIAKAQARALVHMHTPDGETHYVEAAPLRNGLIYVNGRKHGHRAHFEVSAGALAAASSYDRIDAALDRAIWPSDPSWSPPAAPPRRVLQLRFRELLPESRYAFGRTTFASEKARPLDQVRLVNVRGHGNLADLVPAAATAFARERTVRELGEWVDQLGGRLWRGKAATDDERQLGRLIRDQCALLEVRALVAFRKGLDRVPARVRRAAMERMA